MLQRFMKAKQALLAASRSYSSLTQAATVANCSERYKPGEIIHGFIVEEIDRVPEMYLEAIRLSHVKTGAQYLHLNRDDSNNVFSLNFRTIPMNSTGLPHILEHMTLCGSERYPIRDPFMKMLRRSLATFINAMTGPDYTIYPFSTLNPKDYVNLQSVYTDAVFHPRLRDLDFRQEGWRLEHVDPSDKNTPIIIKGVVFNEMKGVFNENQWIFAEQFLNSLLPGHTYSVCSGGYPLEIPNLTHEALKDFHHKFYHPSNCRLYSYGNFPLENHLKFLDDQYLSSAERIETETTRVPSEKRWTEPRREQMTCRPDPLAADPQRQGTIAIGYLCNDITDVQATLELNILSQLLLKGPTAAFYKSLVESNLSSGFGSATGYDSHYKDTIFGVSLQGVKPEDFETIEKVFDETLDKVIDEGFEKDHIEAVLHGIELGIKHQTSNFGMNLLFGLTSLWNHDGNVIRAMKINESLENFNSKLEKDPKYLQNLVKKYLKENQHKLVLSMTPDENYDAKLTEKEEKLLQNKLKECSADDLEKIFENGKILRADQEKKENLDVLPTLKIEDLKKDIDHYIYHDFHVANVPIQLTIQPTNGVSYYRGILSTRDLPEDLKMLIPIFNDVISTMGTKIHDYRTFDRLCSLKTGGLSFSTHVAAHKNNPSAFEEGILISSHCLDRNANDMWNLWLELFNQVDLTDLKRFETLVKESAGDLFNGIADSGHVYAMSSAASLVSPCARLKESLSGLEYILRMKEIAQERDLSPFLEKMQVIRDEIFNKVHFRSSLNVSEDAKDSVLQGLSSFYQGIAGQCLSSVRLTEENVLDTKDQAIHYVMPYATNYTSKAILTVPYNHPEYAALRILAKLISSVYLLPEVREKEGAYGSGANLTSEGIFSFYSFRDPNSTKTFDTFDASWDFLKTFEFKQRDLDEAKLGVFQKIDAPTSPGSRGVTRFLCGITDGEIQAQRLRLKAVTVDDILRVAEKYLKPNSKGVKVARAIVGPENTNLVERKSENWKIISQ